MTNARQQRRGLEVFLGSASCSMMQGSHRVDERNIGLKDLLYIFFSFCLMNVWRKRDIVKVPKCVYRPPRQ